MKKQPTPSKRLTRGALALFLAGLGICFSGFIAGCDNFSTSIENAVTQDEVNFFELTYDPVELAKRTDIAVDTVATYEAYITASEGGVILLDEPEEVVTTLDGIDRLDVVTSTTTETVDAFIIQPYSFPYDTSFVFQVTKLITVDGDIPIIFDCHPDGLVFSKPAILLINAEKDFGKKTEIVCFYYLNETTNKWELLEEVAVVDGLAATNKITHFSRYGAEGKDPKGVPRTD